MRFCKSSAVKIARDFMKNAHYLSFIISPRANLHRVTRYVRLGLLEVRVARFTSGEAFLVSAYQADFHIAGDR